ncbi:hypothetical protein [Streptomyces iconiensis]|uniref:Uncharacterized protein n=1 Tax=Streptomyces iconiensis TaxID=1384038 RepID=A0ABT7A933_9ACTN|nr:hypothetical protein [Streptomyces iconiensis]MDJ1137835.1 hypothetical protein [Streptomyces iconiensis]
MGAVDDEPWEAVCVAGSWVVVHVEAQWAAAARASFGPGRLGGVA